MTAPGVRSALASLDATRAGVERLDDARHPEENAADLIDAWKGAQETLRGALGLTTLAGNGLIREARQREVLTLDQAHALVAFGAAAERAHEATYAPTAGDLEAVRAGFHVLEAALRGAPPGPVSPLSESDTPTPESVPSEGANASAHEVPAPVPDREAATPRRNVLGGVLLAIALLALAGAAGYYAWHFRGGPDHLARGVEAYQAGDPGSAQREFEAAERAMPDAALPHVYLARLAREGGDLPTAVNELTTAIRLEPDNALALREMGSYSLAIGSLDLARRFYVRALEHDPTDSPALGYLGCTLTRLGRTDEAQEFLRRAGEGPWSPCVARARAPGR